MTTNGSPGRCHRAGSSTPAVESLAKFAAASQPAVKALVEEKFGAEGVDMLDAMLADIKKSSE